MGALLTGFLSIHLQPYCTQELLRMKHLIIIIIKTATTSKTAR